MTAFNSNADLNKLKIFRISNKHGDQAIAIASSEEECRNIGFLKGFVRKKENLLVQELSDNVLNLMFQLSPALLERNAVKLRSEGFMGLFRINPGSTELFQMF